MLTPDDMAARYAAAARRCADPVPCGWCLWRAGYRKGRKPRVSHRRPSPGGDLDLFNTGPADPGSNNERTDMDPITRWHITFDTVEGGTFTTTAKTKRDAAREAAAARDLPDGTRRGWVWRTQDDRPLGAAQRITVEVRREIVVTLASGTLDAADSDDAGEVADG